jgi:hypothetical protein
LARQSLDTDSKSVGAGGFEPHESHWQVVADMIEEYLEVAERFAGQLSD